MRFKGDGGLVLTNFQKDESIVIDRGSGRILSSLKRILEEWWKRAYVYDAEAHYGLDKIDILDGRNTFKLVKYKARMEGHGAVECVFIHLNLHELRLVDDIKGYFTSIHMPSGRDRGAIPILMILPSLGIVYLVSIYDIKRGTLSCLYRRIPLHDVRKVAEKIGYFYRNLFGEYAIHCVVTDDRYVREGVLEVYDVKFK